MFSHRLKYVAVLVAIVPACALATTLGRFEFASDFSASDVAPDIVVSGFSSGSAITDVMLENDGQPAPSWFGKNWTISEDPVEALNSDSYAWFRVTPQNGMVMTLSALVFDVRPHGSGPKDFAVSVVNVSSGLAIRMGAGVIPFPDQSVFDGGRKTWETLAANSEAFQSLSGTYEIRIHGFDAVHADREVLFDNVTLEGTISPVPEPTVLAWLPLASLLACRRTRTSFPANDQGAR